MFNSEAHPGEIGAINGRRHAGISGQSCYYHEVRRLPWQQFRRSGRGDIHVLSEALQVYGRRLDGPAADDCHSLGRRRAGPSLRLEEPQPAPNTDNDLPPPPPGFGGGQTPAPNSE